MQVGFDRSRDLVGYPDLPICPEEIGELLRQHVAIVVQDGVASYLGVPIEPFLYLVAAHAGSGQAFGPIVKLRDARFDFAFPFRPSAPSAAEDDFAAGVELNSPHTKSHLGLDADHAAKPRAATEALLAIANAINVEE